MFESHNHVNLLQKNFKFILRLLTYYILSSDHSLNNIALT